MSLITQPVGGPAEQENGLFEHLPVPVLPPSTTLADLTTHGSDHAWLAGTTGIFTSRPSAPLILSWNGTTWAQQPLPRIPTAASLSGIDASSAADVWAVGNAGKDPLVLHYDGTTWTREPTPVIGWLKAVTAGDEVHIVGSSPNSLRGADNTWNTPQALTSPREGLSTISANQPDDVWAGGSGWAGSGPTSYQYPVLVHWDGTKWTGHPLPANATPRGYVTRLAAAPDDVWLGCMTTHGMGIHRWNGQVWTTLPAPNAPGRLTLHGVDVGWTWGTWAEPGTFETRPVFYRWTDTGWTTVALPADLGDKSAYDTGLATTADGTTTWAYLKTVDGVRLLRHRASNT
jgi:hypothetical protein